MNTVIEFLFPTPTAGAAWGLALIALGILAIGWFQLERDDRRDAKAQQLEADQDQAIAFTIDVEPVEPTLVLDIPQQRATNGEDLVGGGSR